MNTGICTRIGKQPPSGLIFSVLYSSIIAWFIFCRSCAVHLANLGQPRRDQLHLRHRPVARRGEREEDELDQHREQDDGDAPVAGQGVELLQQPEQRPGDDREPAVVDHEVEARRRRLQPGAAPAGRRTAAPSTLRRAAGGDARRDASPRAGIDAVLALLRARSRARALSGGSQAETK